MRRLLRLFVITLIVLSSRARTIRAAEATPWLEPANADKYIFVGESVWDVESGKMISQNGKPKGLAPEDASLMVRRMPGVADGLYLCPMSPTEPPGTAQLGYVLQLDGSSQKAPEVSEQVAKAFNTNAPCIWAAPDHRRVVWIQGGDYWRGEIDWASYKIVNPKQVTTVGVFNAGNSPLVWWGHLIYAYGGFDKAKPIVRINLATGATDELETHRAMEANLGARLFHGKVSPHGCRVFMISESVIYSFDLRTGKPTWFHNKFEDTAATRGRNLMMLANPVWADDETSYFPDTNGFDVKLDFRNARMELITRPEHSILLPAKGYLRMGSILPGGQLADFSYSVNVDKGVSAVKSRFLLEIASGKRIDLPFDEKATGQWIDDSIFLYTRTDGGLSGMGTWLYDRKANTNKRLIGTTVDMGRMLRLKNQIFVVSQQSGSNLIRLNLDGQGSQNLGPCALAAVCKMPSESLDTSPIDSETLWKPAAIDEAALAATVPPEAPVGKLKLFELMKDRSPEDQKFAENAYEHAGQTSTYNELCDPVKFATKVMQARDANPNSPEATMRFDMDITSAFDHDRIAASAHDQALVKLVNDPKLTNEQKEQLAEKTGPLVADAFLSGPKPDPRNLPSLVQTTLDKVRAGGATASPAAAANSNTAPPEPQPAANPPEPQPQPAANAQQNQNNQNNQPQQNPPPKQNPPPANSKADKAARDAQKAKDAADRLRRMIGH